MVSGERSIKHIAYVIAHNGLIPEKGFGGCSCPLCCEIREQVDVIKKKEADEFVKSLEAER